MASSKFSPYNQPTIDGVIAAGKSLQISQEKMSFKEVITNTIGDNIIIPYYEVITKYNQLIRPLMRDITLSEEDLYKYKYKPNMYCYDKYGTPELMSSLLYMNNMPSIVNFNKSKISVFPENILAVVKELMVLNDIELKRNRLNLGI